MLALSQAAEPGEENPDRGRRDPCDRVRDEEAGGFFPGEIRGEARLSEGSSMMEKCICVFRLTEESPSLTFLFTMTLTSAFCYCGPPAPPPPACPQSVEHLSWLGLFKDLSEGTHKPSPFYHKRALHKTGEECEHVREKFLEMRHARKWSDTFSFHLKWSFPAAPLMFGVAPAAPCRCPRRWGSTWRHQPSTTGESGSGQYVEIIPYHHQRWETTKMRRSDKVPNTLLLY